MVQKEFKSHDHKYGQQRDHINPQTRHKFLTNNYFVIHAVTYCVDADGKTRDLYESGEERVNVKTFLVNIQTYEKHQFKLITNINSNLLQIEL
jgi:hypothetical protein